MDKRVIFDFEVDFTNGGGIQGQEFRLDIDSDDISDEELAKYIVKDMRLLMVDEVRILNKRIISEKHKRKPSDEDIEK
ncbi:cyclase [Priestia megaterium]|uniref:cyclase n=1 Tax=Priestia megaterium TaxID=1404 RepID=UPI000BF8CBCA|nr:cyclase [Priestia megaterium]MED4617987.1 cyclase [Priestia megaterium]PEW19607.1 cyclase [Priestia megaterium]PEZ43201.1 cyclase [Priestia megaterium]